MAGWLYLAVILDLYARKVGLVDETDAEPRVGVGPQTHGRVLVHFDQGSQYGSDDFKRFCAAHSLDTSMSRRGKCWVNAVAEPFFSSLKKEPIHKRIYKTCALARADVFDVLQSNPPPQPSRRHQPEAFERASA